MPLPSSVMEPADVPPTLVCHECGGTAHLLVTLDPDEILWPGQSLPYRCADCLDRLDVVVVGDDDHDGRGNGSHG